MIRLGCYEFIVCKGNVFKRIRKTKTHACLCCRAAVSFCNVALHLHLVIRLCANWAAVRQPVQALHGVIPASEPESWAASCVVLHCAIAGDAARNVSTMPRLRLASGSLARQLGGGSAIRASTSSRHSGLRAGILGGLMRSIALHCRLAIVHPRQRLPRPRVGARGDGANAPFVPSCPSALPPRTPTVSFRAPNRNPGLPCAGYCATTTPLPSPASAPQGAGSEAGMTDGKETRKG